MGANQSAEEGLTLLTEKSADNRKMKRMHGYDAHMMKERMINCLLRSDDEEWKQIGRVISQEKMTLLSTSKERYRLCNATSDGGGAWFYHYETPEKKWPLQIYYCLAPGEDMWDSQREEGVKVFYYSRKKEVLNEVKKLQRKLKFRTIEKYIDLSEETTVKGFIEWWLSRERETRLTILYTINGQKPLAMSALTFLTRCIKARTKEKRTISKNSMT